MIWFRLYFLDTKSRISARDEFEAEDDQRAIMIAGMLYDACSDRSTGFELWRGASRLLPPRNEEPAKPVCNLAELELELQTIVLEREEILANSHWRIAKSKRLQARIAELQGSPPATAGDGGPSQFELNSHCKGANRIRLHLLPLADSKCFPQ